MDEPLQDELLEIAVIIGPHGVRGQVRLKVFLEDPTALLEYGQPLWAKGSPAPAIVINGEARGALIVKLANVTNRSAAEKMKGKKMYLPKDALPPVEDEDEFYVSDLIGLDVIDADGVQMGQVKTVEDYGAGDVVDIVLTATGKSLLLPFTKALFPTIDMDARKLTCVDPGEVTSQDEEGAVH